MLPDAADDDGAGIHREGAPSDETPGRPSFTDRLIGGRYRVIAWLGLSILMLIAKGGDAIDCFSPPEDLADFCARDLSQDWISARAVLAGRPAYAPLRSLLEGEFGPDALPADASILPYNAHPPGMFLLTLPLAPLGFKDAWIAWSVLTVVCLLASICIILAKLTGRIGGAVLPLLLVAIATSHPFQDTIYHGQFNGVLLLLITAAWAALEERPRAAGILIGLAVVIKLSPCLLLLPLLGRRRWPSIIAAVACVALLSVASMGLVGYQGWRRYALEVVPAIGPDHGAAWGNQSLVGLYHKLFGDTRGKFLPLYRSTTLERTATLISVALACFCALASGSIERRKGPNPEHYGYMLTIVALLIIPPVVWNHYFLLLILPMAWSFSIERRPIPRMAILALAAILWLPRWTIWKFAAPGSVHDGRFDVVGPLATATGLASQTYAILAFYCVLLCLFFVNLKKPVSGTVRGKIPDAHRP